MLKIEFEGTDAAGKTTGLKYFILKAKELGLSVEETKEVGNPHLKSCIKLRQLVLDPSNSLSGESMELIFFAMRIENDRWLNELKKTGKIDLVVSDRGFFSHLAYGLHNTSESFISSLFENLIAKTTSLPDIVIYFKVDTVVAKQRMIDRGQIMDAIEQKGVQYQENVRNAFDSYFNKYPNIKVFTVDANQDIENVKKQLDEILNNIYNSMILNSRNNL